LAVENGAGDLGFDAAPALAHWAPQHWPVAPGWQGVVDDFLASAPGQKLLRFCRSRLATGATVYPPQPFRALELTPPASVGS
jgi:uracil-DNA glycosylase